MESGSPADRIGIRKGDAVISLNGESFSTHHGACRILQDAKFEEQDVSVEIMRGQTKLTGTLGATLRALRRSRPTRRIVSNESLTPLHFEIHKQQKLFVADIGYKEPEWQLVFSKDTGFTDQKIRFVADEEELTSVIESDDLSGFYITNVAYGDGRWVVVFHKGASYVEQQIM